ncbi:MAG: glycerophosphodiester phosphodiesterase family protein [Candidatus Merdivicinus sp.]|jgi:glycerophosphoryl diester phosphodiesterase
MELKQILKDRSRILVAGHRGMKALYPENTQISFEKALLLPVDMIETDLRLTKDGEVVLIHDETVDRTTNGSGLVRDYTLSELKKLDAGIPFSPEFSGQQIPTLREFCQWMRPYPDMLYNIEIKDYTEETVDRSMAILNESGMTQKCVFTAFDAAILTYLKERYGVLTQGFRDVNLKNYQPGPGGTYEKMDAACLFLGEMTPERVFELEDLGILPWCCCPDDEAGVRESVRCGVRLMTCNNPLPALQVLRELELHP